MKEEDFFNRSRVLPFHSYIFNGMLRNLTNEK